MSTECQQREWTPEYVAGLMARSPLKNRESELLRGYGAVSDAHNAALSAERQRREQAERQDWRHMEKAHKEVELMRAQLLSAQAAIEKAQEVMRLMHESTLQASGTKSEADLGRASYLAFKQFIDTKFDLSALHKYRDELLLPYQVAIEEHNEEMHGTQFVIDVDLSLLHQHDAEVRKPLVEALELMFQVHVLRCHQCCGPDDGCDEGQRLEQIKLDALAKAGK